MSGTLYVTGTPIGNLEDITLRQLRILKEVDFIAAEDTRVTRKLLTHFDIKNELVSYHEHSSETVLQKIAERIENGENCAIVTDAGMPCISDPGEELVRICRKRNISVQAVPGASAVITALAISGSSAKQFAFYGFLPVEKKFRSEMLNNLRSETKTAVLYEAPHKLCKTISALAEISEPEREIFFCRELTKIHEEVLNMTISEAVKYYTEHEPKGEFVILLEGVKPERKTKTLTEAVALAEEYLQENIHPSTAAKLAAKETGLPKNQIYQAMHGKF